jgi:hypothetical protein
MDTFHHHVTTSETCFKSKKDEKRPLPEGYPRSSFGRLSKISRRRKQWPTLLLLACLVRQENSAGLAGRTVEQWELT